MKIEVIRHYTWSEYIIKSVCTKSSCISKLRYTISTNSNIIPSRSSKASANFSFHSNFFYNKDNYSLNNNFLYYKTYIISKTFVINRIITTNWFFSYSNIIKDDCINYNNHKGNIYNHLFKNNTNHLKININNNKILFQLQLLYSTFSMKKS